MEPAVMDEILNHALLLTKDSREYIREGFLSVFVYLPMVLGSKFEPLVPQTVEMVVESISSDKDRIRNLAIKSMKILIQNFLTNDIDVIVTPFFEGAVSENSTRRNSSLILLGDVLDLLHHKEPNREELYNSYQRLFAIFYILKNDSVADVRTTATNVFKTFVDNPTRCLQKIYSNLVDCFISLYLRGNDHFSEIADAGLKDFAYKYGDIFASKIVSNASFARNKADSTYKKGICLFFCRFIFFFNQGYLSAERRVCFYEILFTLFSEPEAIIWQEALKGLRVLFEKVGDPKLFDDLLVSSIPEFIDTEPSSPLFDKQISFFSEFLQSQKQKFTEKAVGYLLQTPMHEWQLELIIRHAKLLGSLLYSSSGLEDGINIFFTTLEVI
jgi:hypothetical protein